VNEEDRGWQELQLPVTLENNSRLQIEFLPRRSYERDWLLLESVTITQPANR
jgi:hypothetical protein